MEKLVVRTLRVEDATLQLEADVKAAEVAGTETPVRTVITIDYHIVRADDLDEVFTLKSEHVIPNDIAFDVPGAAMVPLPTLVDDWPDARPWRYRARTSVRLQWVLANLRRVDKAALAFQPVIQMGGSLVLSPSKVSLRVGDIANYQAVLAFADVVYGDVTDYPETVVQFAADGIVGPGPIPGTLEALKPGTTKMTFTHLTASGTLSVEVE